MDLETPLSFFKRLERDRYSFLLESVEGSERWARYSFLGTRPQRIFKARGNQVEIIENGKTEKLTFTSAASVARRASERLPAGDGGGRAAVFWRRAGLRRLRCRRTISRDRKRQKRSARHAGDFFLVRANARRLRQSETHDQSHRQRPRRAGDQLAPRLRPIGQAHPQGHFQLAKKAARHRAARFEPGQGHAKISLQSHPGEIQEAVSRSQRVYQSRRYHSGRALPAARNRDRQRSLRDLSRAALRQPVALHVLPGAGRSAGHRLIAGNHGAAHRRYHRASPDRRHAPARRHAGRRTRA